MSTDRPIPFAQLSGDFFTHKKPAQVAQLLGLELDAGRWLCIGLWIHAITHCVKGRADMEDLLEAAQQAVTRHGLPAAPQDVVAAWQAAGLVDEHRGIYKVHNWQLRYGKLLAQREGAAKRMAEKRARDRAKKRGMCSEKKTSSRSFHRGPVTRNLRVTLLDKSSSYQKNSLPASPALGPGRPGGESSGMSPAPPPPSDQGILGILIPVPARAKPEPTPEEIAARAARTKALEDEFRAAKPEIPAVDAAPRRKAGGA